MAFSVKYSKAYWESLTPKEQRRIERETNKSQAVVEVVEDNLFSPCCQTTVYKAWWAIGKMKNKYICSRCGKDYRKKDLTKS